jgi:hypothetical protein
MVLPKYELVDEKLKAALEKLDAMLPQLTDKQKETVDKTT